MEREIIEVYCGDGRGKTALALGQCLRAAVLGKSVKVIQFMKGRESRSLDFIQDIPDYDIGIFRFEKQFGCYETLGPSEREEANANIRNGINYAHRVIQTRDCDFLVLDEILGVLDYGIISSKELGEMLSMKADSTRIVITGTKLPEDLIPYVDAITRLTIEKEAEN